MDFSEKVVLITGAAGGIGSEAAKIFASKGAKVALVDLNLQALEKTARDLNLTEGNYLLIAADVSEEHEVVSYVNKTKETFGKIDVFFNNAGIEGVIKPIIDYPSDVFNRVLKVNVSGIFYGLKHVIPVMVQQKAGAIINSSSVSGLIGPPGQAAYVASKHAVNGLTKVAALEYAEMGVRVNSICPCPVNTRMMRSIESGAAPGNPEAAKETFTNMIPLKRYAEPLEIVNLVLFLASEKSSYITGVNYSIDGGFTAI